MTDRDIDFEPILKRFFGPGALLLCKYGNSRRKYIYTHLQECIHGQVKYPVGGRKALTRVQKVATGRAEQKAAVTMGGSYFSEPTELSAVGG